MKKPAFPVSQVFLVSDMTVREAGSKSRVTSKWYLTAGREYPNMVLGVIFRDFCREGNLAQIELCDEQEVFNLSCTHCTGRAHVVRMLDIALLTETRRHRLQQADCP